MINKRPLSPAIVNKFDKNLLKNRPDIWSARTHMVWYYSILYFILLAVISYISQTDVRESSAVITWSIFTSLISFVGFIFWLIYLLRFNVFKRYGIQNKWDGLRTYILYFLAIAPFVMAPFIFSWVETKKANMTYTADELAEDINNINLWVNQLERDSIPQKFSSDTFVVNKDGKSVVEDIDYSESTGRMEEFHRFSIDTATLRERLANADSSRKVDDTTYIFYDSPDYLYVRDYSLWKYSTVQHLSSKKIYDKVFGINTIDRENVQKNLERLVKKYSIKYHNVTNDIERNYKDRIKDKYNLYEIDRNIGSITSKKFMWNDEGVTVFLHIFYYIVLILSILVFSLRHSTVRTFFLTVLSAILLTIISGIFIGISGFDEKGGFGAVLFYYFLFGALAIVGLSANVRTAVSGICINLFLWITPFVPLVGVALYYQILHQRFSYLPYSSEEYQNYFENETLHYFIAETAGFVLLLILLEPLFKNLYCKWYSLPEQ